MSKNLKETPRRPLGSCPQRYLEDTLLIINKALGLDSFPINRLIPSMKMSPGAISQKMTVTHIF